MSFVKFMGSHWPTLAPETSKTNALRAAAATDRASVGQCDPMNFAKLIACAPLHRVPASAVRGEIARDADLFERRAQAVDVHREGVVVHERIGVP